MFHGVQLIKKMAITEDFSALDCKNMLCFGSPKHVVIENYHHKDE